MLIMKILNNNVISTKDKHGNEMVVMGRGLAFGCKTGDFIHKSKVEKIFRLENQDSMKKMKELLAHIPMEYFKIADDIIIYGKKSLNIKLNENIYLTLTDHISFAIERFHGGMNFANALEEEVKLFYPQEYAIGQYGVDLIYKETHIQLPETEAASIALHIINAEYNAAISQTMTSINIMNDMMQMICQAIHKSEKECVYNYWIVSSLKFLAHRMLLLEPMKGYEDAEFFSFLQSHCKWEMDLVIKIKNFMKEKYNCQMTKEEQVYLTLHIKRIRDLNLDNGGCHETI